MAGREDDSLLTKADIGEILRDELNRVPLRAHICERAGFVYAGSLLALAAERTLIAR